VKRGFREVRAIAKTTPEYFDLVPLGWLAGSAAKALTHPNKVALTRSRAERFFPRQSPEKMLGKSLRYESFRDTITAVMAGVVDDLGFPSRFIEQELLTASESDERRWGSVNSGDQLWLVLRADADAATIERNLNEVSEAKGGAELK
jgi:hypothetical protein